MHLVPETPTRLRLSFEDSLEASVRAALTYKDQKIAFQLKKFKKAFWFKEKHGVEKWELEIERLEQALSPCMLFRDDQGWWTYTGLAAYLVTKFGATCAAPAFTWPEPEGWRFPWHKEPTLTPYEFQQLAKSALLDARHAAVEIGTGLGKSLIILMLIKFLGLRTVVMAPSLDIAKRLFDDLTEAFGPGYVGFFGDGKKQSSKKITVAIGASLTRLKPDSKEWKEISKAQVFIADESHQCPAATLERVCHGVLSGAPWRFFFSATQMRNDGLDLLLAAITGPVVYTKTVAEGIAEGYLARLHFYMMQLLSPTEGVSYDPNENTRDHLYYNKRVIQAAAAAVNHFVLVEKKQVLVLVEEMEQFTKLLPHLKAEVRFAHGGVSKENKSKVPEDYHDSDPSALVKAFNAEKFPILVGTSCITTGTDVKANEVTVYLQGGRSEIQVLQGACGRSTRLFTYKDGRKKTDCRVIDFDVTNIETTHRHAAARKDIYASIAPVKEVNREC